MDFSKYPLEKLLYFIAGIIPGSVAILIYVVANPVLYQTFLNAGGIGYRTRWTLIIFAAFVIGHTLTSLCNSAMQSLGYVIGYITASINFPKFGYAFNIAPWRETRWRNAAIGYLGSTAPPDTQLLTPQLVEIKQSGIDLLPEPDRSRESLNLMQEKIKTVEEDRQWQQWYEQFHTTVLAPNDNDVVFHVRNGLHVNLQTAAIYTAIAFCFVPSIRHWL